MFLVAWSLIPMFVHVLVSVSMISCFILVIFCPSLLLCLFVFPFVSSSLICSLLCSLVSPSHMCLLFVSFCPLSSPFVLLLSYLGPLFTSGFAFFPLCFSPVSHVCRLVCSYVMFQPPHPWGVMNHKAYFSWAIWNLRATHTVEVVGLLASGTERRERRISLRETDR